MSDLKSRLIATAEIWASAHDCGLSRLGKRVAGDANFFVRLESPDSTFNVATLEKFARFLSEAANWPEGLVPEEVCTFAHVVGVSSPACAPSPDSGPCVIVATHDLQSEAAPGPSGAQPSGRTRPGYPDREPGEPLAVEGSANQAPSAAGKVSGAPA